MDLTLRPSPKLTGLKWAPSERKPGWALSAPPPLISYLKSLPLEGLTPLKVLTHLALTTHLAFKTHLALVTL